MPGEQEDPRADYEWDLPPGWRWDLVGLAAVLAVGLAHLHFAYTDLRFPSDLGLFYKSLPKLYGSLGFSSLWPNAFAEALGDPGGARPGRLRARSTLCPRRAQRALGPPVGSPGARCRT